MSVALVASTSAVDAQTVNPTGYDGPNGSHSNYWDDTYNGSGAGVANAFLSGGIGQLSDGIWSPSEFYIGNVPWVGWDSYNPFIVFHFAVASDFNTLRVHFENSNFAGVGAPRSVTIGTFNGTGFGSSQTYAVTAPPPTAPFWASFDVSGQGLTGISDVAIQINRGAQWTFVDEVEFAGAAVVTTPEPATVSLLALGLLGIAGLRARRTRA